MINKVVLVGRLTKEIELRKTPNNISTCRFTVACDRRYASANNNSPTADFISCVAWRQAAEFLARYATKGSIVGVEGSIQTGSYEGKNGRVYTTDVVCDNVRLIGGNRNNNGAEVASSNTNQTFTPSQESFPDSDAEDVFADTPSLDISSDDLPFY